MVRRTETIFKRIANKGKPDEHIQRVKKTTIWIFFLPIYSWEEIIATNL